MKTRKCAMFDLDGTLFDTSEGIKRCYRKGLERFGISLEDDKELDKVIGPSLYISYSRFFGLQGDDVIEAVGIYRELYVKEGIYQLRMYDGVEEMLSTLKLNGFTICLATAKPYVMAQKALEFTGLKQYFDVVCGANLDGSMSDKIDLINESLKQAGFTDRSLAWMIGDRLYDILGAKKAGVRSVGVTYGFGTRQELEEAGADFLVDSACEIPKLLIS